VRSLSITHNYVVYTPKLLTMTDFQDIKVYKFGFIFNGVTFCWFNKNLYRMPYQKELRFYEKRKLKMQKVGNSIGYWICGIFKSMKNLKQITNEINYKEVILVDHGLPF